MTRRRRSEPKQVGWCLCPDDALAGCADRRELARLSPTIVIPTWGASTMRLSILTTLHFVIGLVAVLGFAGAVPAQTTGGDLGGTRGGADLSFTVSAGAESGMKTDVQGGGDLDVFRMRFGVTGKAGLTRDLDLAVSVGYGPDLYDFSGTTRLGGIDPLVNIYTPRNSALLRLCMSGLWALVVWPVS